MSVDQIRKFLWRWMLPGMLLFGCQLNQDEVRQAASASPSDRPAMTKTMNEPGLEPPLALKALKLESLPSLHVLGSLVSRDHAGYLRLQLYLQHSGPVSQNFYWQIIQLYRSQFDIIWIYVSANANASETNWYSRGAWIGPHLPKSLHIPGFRATENHDGLYWTQNH
jgi:hypothetical protein